jgi:hypothetical protein
MMPSRREPPGTPLERFFMGAGGCKKIRSKAVWIEGKEGWTLLDR